MIIIKNSMDLKLAIQELEIKKMREEFSLKEQVQVTLDSFSPVTMLKSSLHEIVSSSEIKKDLSTIIIGLITGFVAKKVVVGETTNPIKGFFGKIVEMVATSESMKHSEGIKSIGSLIFNKFINRNSEETLND